MTSSDYRPTPNLLADRTVLITGAGQGIGRACAHAFAAHGATVVLLDKTLRTLETVYDEIEQSGGPQPAIYPMNLEGAAPKDYEDMAATLEKEFGRLDGLLHNAAALGDLTPIEHYDVDLWYRVLQVNLSGPFMLTRACLGLLRRAPDASIIFTTDEVGRQGRAYWGAYAVSKFAIEGLSQVLADELGGTSPVRVNAVDPGPVRTALRGQAFPAEDVDTLTDPDSVTTPYLYLIGPDSRGVTGHRLEARELAPG